MNEGVYVFANCGFFFGFISFAELLPLGTHIINLKKTWEKLLLAARAIAAIENPADVVVVSARPFAHRALMKFAAHTGATPIFGRFAPGALTNQVQKNFREPRVIVISDPTIDHQVWFPFVYRRDRLIFRL